MKNFLRALWAKPIIRHLISAAAAVVISTNLPKAGVDADTARQVGQGVGEVIKHLPAE